MVFEARFYEGFADMLKGDELPIFNWIWFGLWRNEKGLNGYTYGMEAFGKDEMGVLGADAEPGDLRTFWPASPPMCWKRCGAPRRGNHRASRRTTSTPITRSPGGRAPLPEEQMTLKNLLGSRRPGG